MAADDILYNLFPDRDSLYERAIRSMSSRTRMVGPTSSSIPPAIRGRRVQPDRACGDHHGQGGAAAAPLTWVRRGAPAGRPGRRGAGW